MESFAKVAQSISPCTLERAIFCQEEADVSDKERHAYQKQAAEDWETILINRAREMKTGAHLIIGLMGLKDANEFRRPNSGGTPAYLRVLRDIWWSNVEQGVITKEEFKNTNAAYYRRSEVELKAPFVSKDSKVLKEGLKLISIKMKDVPINPAAMVGKDKVTGTRSIKRYVNSVQAWSNAIFYSGLSEHRSEEERKVIMDQLYSQFEECIMCNPDDFIFEFTMAYVDIVKT
ncbi:uncharacterized protein LOC106175088 [Lingula anatina]|uniref:Uncharacterized protein LOC106175088 n=1 Tax=Lingula anatina TaxID=7574 RepID=A0A1S3JPT3_LINAN|nr:uncharacterized protein LOC106175088 [Lingula anatina]|eukprot:XP_013412367.1 uncharacterized protein LOC106175088 [Lingula anatina]